jgi:hypothetical protein
LRWGESRRTPFSASSPGGNTKTIRNRQTRFRTVHPKGRGAYWGRPRAGSLAAIFTMPGIHD